MNLPTFTLRAAAVSSRNGEYTGTPFTDLPGSDTYADPQLGCNKAGSNAPGIGICTDNVDPKTDDWSTLDQAAAARDPQDSQHIGGTGLGGTLPSSGGTEGLTTVEPVTADQGADINDTLTFEVAAAQAAPGIGFGPANGDPINRSSVTIEIGDRAWGTNTVA